VSNAVAEGKKDLRFSTITMGDQGNIMELMLWLLHILAAPLYFSFCSVCIFAGGVLPLTYSHRVHYFRCKGTAPDEF